MTRNGLLVLADEQQRPTGATRRFRKDVLADGGVWESRPNSMRALLDMVKAGAPGSHVLMLGSTDEPVLELHTLVTSAMHARGLADVLYGNFVSATDEGTMVGTTDDTGESPMVRRPAWSPHRLQNENYVGETFLVQTSYFVLTLERLLVDNERKVWNSWEFLAAGIAHNATVERVDAAWTYSTETSGSDGLVTSGSHFDDGWKPTRKAHGMAPTPEACELITLTAGAADASRGHASLIEECLAAMSATDAAHASHTIVIGEECGVAVRERLEASPAAHVSLVPAVGEFNFAARCNEVAIKSDAEILVFVNDDFIPSNASWLSDLLAPFADPNVAITGGTLLYADETIQHIGIGIVRGNYQHVFVGEPLHHPRVEQLAAMNREVDAVTGACFAMRSDVFHHVGGFCEGFPLNYNDVDLCLKARAAGYSVVHVGAPLGYHLESKTRHAVMLAEETALFESRWLAGGVAEYSFDYSF